MTKVLVCLEIDAEAPPRVEAITGALSHSTAAEALAEALGAPVQMWLPTLDDFDTGLLGEVAEYNGHPGEERWEVVR
jgi:hypothetical protein